MLLTGKCALTGNRTNLGLLGGTLRLTGRFAAVGIALGYRHVCIRSEVVMNKRRRRPQHSALIPWLVLLLSAALLTSDAWGARSTAFRGQWSAGELIGALVVLGVLVGLVLFLVWPRQRS